MTEILFLDLDDTILDFHKAERLAVAKTFREFGLEPTDAVLTRYHEINKQHWQRLETVERRKSWSPGTTVWSVPVPVPFSWWAETARI